MRQTVLSVVLEVQPASASRLREIIRGIRKAEETVKTDADWYYDRLRHGVPLLQFMSMTVCEDAQFDPVLVIECNFDGAPGPFWAQLENLYSKELRDMLRCCQRPRGKLQALFDHVTAPESRAAIAPFLEAATIWPAVFHIGNRGLPRERSERETALFDYCQKRLDDEPALRSRTATEVHAALRTGALAQFPWLNKPEQPQVSTAENIADWANLIGFLVLAVAVLTVPGLLLRSTFPSWLPALLGILGTVWAGFHLNWMKDPALPGLMGLPNPPVIIFGIGGVALFGAVVSVGADRFLHWSCVSTVGAMICSAGALLAVILAWIDVLETADPPQTAPPLNEQKIRDQIASEDRITQNHMISIVHLKPGVLRAILIRAGLWGLGYYLRLQARDGYLASMRTIHFAHWAFVSNGSRLMFHSNFDGTWESYLDDFIEKAHAGLTLAWSSGVGFPPARFLAFEGATHGLAFKNWARHSMTASQFWFSAYRDLTVNQIERQVLVADGLRTPTLPEVKAAAWARRL